MQKREWLADMPYLDLDEAVGTTTPESEAENRRKVLSAIAASPKIAPLQPRSAYQPPPALASSVAPGSRDYNLNVAATNQPAAPAPRVTPAQPPSLNPSFDARPPVLGNPPARPMQSTLQPSRADFQPKPELSGWKKVLGLGAGLAIGSAPLVHETLYGQRDKAERQYKGAEKEWEAGQADQVRQAQIRNIDSEIAARAKDKPEKPENLQQEYADAVRDAQTRGVDPAKDTKVQQLADAITSLQKQPAPPKENKAVAGTVNEKPAWGLQTETGWIDPQTRQSIPDFKPAPNFAQTGFYEPVEVPQAGGGLAPGVFDKRTGRTTVTPPGKTPVPREAQKQIDDSLATARGMDRLERAQGEILQGVAKRGQSGPLGGGPYLTGPESMQFVANHIAVTFGSVKGARIGRDIIEQHVKARDLDQATEAAAQRVLSGGIITYQQAQQMMETAKINRRQAWQQAQDAAGQYGVPDAVKMPSDLAPATPKGGGFKPF